MNFTLNKFIKKNWKFLLLPLLTFNFIIRIVIYQKTTLFHFSDYAAQWQGIAALEETSKIPLFTGNFQMATSYLGYFIKSLFGSIDYFFLLNCIIGSMTSLILFILAIKLVKSYLVGLLIVLLHSVYTEYLVFSSVLYSPVIMLFLLSLILLLFYYYYTSSSRLFRNVAGILSIITICTTYFLKPELIFFSIFLFFYSIIFIKFDHLFYKRSLLLSLSIMIMTIIFASVILSKTEAQKISNDFIFFGHTDYGGEGGEGSFITSENKTRYNIALSHYCQDRGITVPTIKDHNRFQLQEIKKYITLHPFKWVGLQFTKISRTFGIVPESSSFKILYSGLLKEKLWLTAIVVVAPVALIILMFILFFNYPALRNLTSQTTYSGIQNIQDTTLNSEGSQNIQQSTPSNNGFFYIYLLMFFYYIIISVFLGHYQERYRLPIMVAFIIPVLCYFIASYDKTQFLNKVSLSIKGGIIVLLLLIWTFQAKEAILDKARLQNALKSVTLGKTSG
jgi:hypothetical protein